MIAAVKYFGIVNDHLNLQVLINAIQMMKVARQKQHGRSKKVVLLSKQEPEQII